MVKLTTRTKRVVAVAMSIFVAVTTLLPSGLTSADEISENPETSAESVIEDVEEVTTEAVTEAVTSETTEVITEEVAVSEEETTEEVTTETTEVTTETVTESEPENTESENVIAIPEAETGETVSLVAGGVEFSGLNNTEIISRILLDDFWYNKVTEDECVTVFGYSKANLQKGREALIEADKDYYEAEIKAYEGNPVQGFVANNLDSINNDTELRTKTVTASSVNGLVKLVDIAGFKTVVSETLVETTEEATTEETTTEQTTTEETVTDETTTEQENGDDKENTDSDLADNLDNEENEEIPVNGIYLSYYSEDEIYELLFTDWAFGFTEEDAQNGFGMSLEEFVEYRKQIKAEKWSEDGFLESLVLAEIIDLSADEDFKEWVTDEQLETCFGMSRETFEALGETEELIEAVSDVISRDMRVSSGTHICNYNYSSWRSNWSTFLSYCKNAVSSTATCSGYVSSVLNQNGENCGTLNTTQFASWLPANGYYDVLGGRVDCVSNGSLTTAGVNAIKQIQDGDILLWWVLDKNGNVKTKHIGIGYVYDGNTGGLSVIAPNGVQTGEVCMIQSDGNVEGSLGYSTCAVNTITYYLSGAGSGDGNSYGDILQIWRKNTVSACGTLTVNKTINGYNTTTNSPLVQGWSIAGLYFELYKVGSSSSTWENDINNSSNWVATFYTNSNTGKCYVANYNTDISGLGKSSDSSTLTGIPQGTYVFVENSTAKVDSITASNNGNDYVRGDSGAALNSFYLYNDNGGSRYSGYATDKDQTLSYDGADNYYAYFSVNYGVNNHIIVNNRVKQSSISVKKKTDTGEKLSDVVLGLYKVNFSDDSYLNSSKKYLDTDSIDLSGLNSENINKEEGKLTKIATFVTDSKGLGHPTLTDIVGASGSWTNITIDEDTGTILNAPTGDYIIIEEPSTVSSSTWKKGGTYDGVTLDDTTVNSLFKVYVDGSSGVSTYYNGMYSEFYDSNDSVELYNKLCNFGLNNGKQYYAAFRIDTSDSQYTNIEVVCSNKEDTDSITLVKSSANTAITSNNSCYSLKGATYAVYNKYGGYSAAESANKNNYKSLYGYVGELVVKDEDGNTNILDVTRGQTYYVKEVISPKGYALDSTVYTCDLSDATKVVDGTYTLKVTDTPQMDPISVLITKKDSTDDVVVAGAEVTVKYYKNEYDTDPALSGATPERTWVMKTDANGKIKMDNDHKLSGDEWYINPNTGVIEFPLGTVTIQETKAPAHYKLNKEVFVRKITGSGITEDVTTYNEFDLMETPYRMPVCFTKIGETTTEGRFNALANAGFMIAPVSELKKDSEGNYIWDETKAVAFNSNGTVDNYKDDTLELFTDENGYALSTRLKDGTYLLHESTVPENYVAIEDTVFTIDTSDMTDDDVANPPTLNLGFFSDARFKGYLRIAKVDGDTQKNLINTDNNISFKIWSYEDNKYVSFKVYDSVKKKFVSVSEFTVDDNGYIVTPGTIVSGKYRLEETNGLNTYYSKDPNGYFDFTINNQTLYEMYVEDDGTVTNVPVFTVTVDNTAVSTDLSVNKVGRYYDEENGKYVEKNIYLPGISFDIIADGDIISSDGQTVLYNDGDVIDTITTDESGIAELYDIPLGKYIIHEQEAKDGYYAMDDVSFESSADDDIVTETLEDGTVRKYVKVEKQLVNYKEVTISTHAYGETETSTANAEKEATVYDDVFMTNLVIGKLYTIKGTLMDKETGDKLLDADGNEITAEKVFVATQGVMTVTMSYTFDASLLGGKQTVVFEDLYKDDKKVASHADLTDENQTVNFIRIKTTLLDNVSVSHTAFPAESTVLNDTITYSGLTPGKEYKLSGKLMDKETGEPFLDSDGKEVYAEKTFIPKTESGVETVTFTFNATGKTGMSVVAFEDCYDTEEDREVAFHTDITDEDQTVHFPKIGTTATSDGNKKVKPSKTTEIVDKVAYTNLVPGYTYEVSGIIMDKDTGEALTIDGQNVTAKATFVPETADGEVSVVFTLDTTNFANHVLVVFEELSVTKDKEEVTPTEDNKVLTPTKIAEHKDINDNNQSVKVTENPSNPPKTGDIIKYVLGGIVVLGAALILVLKSMRKKSDKTE